MALGTLSGEVVSGLIFRMAGGAIGQSLVAETGWPPCPGGMTARALPGEVVCWTVAGVAGKTIFSTCRSMVEADLLPGIGGVAGGAIACEMKHRFDIVVAGLALARSTRKPALCMAGFAFQLSMAASQRKKGVLCSIAAGQE